MKAHRKWYVNKPKLWREISRIFSKKNAKITTLDYVDVLKTLIDSEVAPGDHEAVWDGTDQSGEPVSPGIFFSVLRTQRETVSRKMTLLQ